MWPGNFPPAKTWPGGFSPPNSSFPAHPPPSYDQPGGFGPPNPSFPIHPSLGYNAPMSSLPTVAPAYFGPYLRYGDSDLTSTWWFGSALIVAPITVAAPLSLTLHPTVATPEVPQALTVQSNIIDTYGNYSFHRFDLAIPMLSRSTPWTYTISIDPTVSHQFFVAPANNPHWRFLFASCNGFSASVTPEVRAKLGGVGALWKDVLELHRTPGREFHVMIGGGDQVYADPIWKELPSLQAWLALKGKENRRNAPWSPQLENDVSNYYFNLYTTHFNSPHLKEAAASIPSIYQIDDHDIWDGFGSYPEYLQHSIYFQNMGRIAWKFYRIFQQHTTERLVAPGGPHAAEFLIPGGNTYHFIKLLGPNVALVGPDTRGERNPMQVLSPQSYDMIFNYMATRLPPTVRHVIWMLAVPIAYPRLSMPETLLKHFGKAKTGANKAVNQIGKGVGAVAGGAGRVLRAVGVNVNADQWQTQSKGAVDDVLGNMKKGLGKSGLMSSVISQFGEVDLLDDMIDHWTHPNHAAERTAFVQRCQEYSRTFHRRITFISGDVHCAGIGRFYNPAFAATPHTDPSLMYQIIASAIVNIPPPNGVLKMLHSNAKVYDLDGATKEDMLDMFPIDVDGSQMQMKKLIGRRNYGIGTVDPKGQDVSFELRIEGVQEVGRCVSYGPVIVPPLQ